MTSVQLVANSTDVQKVLIVGVLGFVLSMLLTPIYTHLAYKHKWWKKARTHAVTGEKAPIIHQIEAEKHKRIIPTMGGSILILAIAFVTILFNWNRNQTWLPTLALVGAGTIGLVDDYINVRGSSNLAGGLRARLKFWLITLVALLGGLYFYYKLGYHLIHIPSLGNYSIGWLYIPLFVLVVVSTANAVNITDGLDGLAGGLLSIAFAAYTAIAFWQGSYGIAAFCATVLGAMLTYTWFSIFPIRFLMGDSGAFGIGTALGVVAMLTNSIIVLPIIAGVFVIEAASSVIQIFSKRVFRRKVFISAPIHNHFRAIGWPEPKVTMRFWVVGQVFAFIGLIIYIFGGW